MNHIISRIPEFSCHPRFNASHEEFLPTFKRHGWLDHPHSLKSQKARTYGK
jgi:hypothetical protein